MAKRAIWPTVLCGAWFYAAILLCWRWNGWLFALLALGSGWLLTRQPARQDVVVWTIGTVACLSAAVWRAQQGIWSFANPDWFAVPSWIFWVYGTLMLCTIHLVEWTHGQFTSTFASRRSLRMALYAVGVAGIIGFGAVTIRTLPPRFAWMVASMTVIVLVCWPTPRHLSLFWLAAVVGLVAEASGIAAGIYAYPFPVFADFRYVAILQFGWGLSAMWLYSLSTFTVERLPRPRRRDPRIDTP